MLYSKKTIEWDMLFVALLIIYSRGNKIGCNYMWRKFYIYKGNTESSKIAVISNAIYLKYVDTQVCLSIWKVATLVLTPPPPTLNISIHVISELILNNLLYAKKNVILLLFLSWTPASYCLKFK